jgi:large subunit ribosomal protein L11
MTKKVIAEIRLSLPAGAATSEPVVGPALEDLGVDIMSFCEEYNARTKNMVSMIIPAVISVYADRSFTFELRSPTAYVLLQKAAGVIRWRTIPDPKRRGKVTRKQLEEIAETKKADLNVENFETALRMVTDAAIIMGIEIDG